MLERRGILYESLGARPLVILNEARLRSSSDGAGRVPKDLDVFRVTNDEILRGYAALDEVGAARTRLGGARDNERLKRFDADARDLSFNLG
ncbi:MAG: hypothetical protein U5O39_01155 [Gammaproteobacteria bacterium]|nr:hypothetical protein [Gammaproteobacteria bacterium]